MAATEAASRQLAGPAVNTNTAATYNGAATSGQAVVLHDATGAAITHNLPTAVSNKALITIKKIDASANTVTIDGNGTQTIDGGLTAVLRRQYESVTLVSDGANWHII